MVDIDKFLADRNINSARGAGLEDVGVGNQRISGQFLWSGNGEGKKEVQFPVKFIEKPVFYFGGELGPGQTIVDGFYPTVSVAVGQWQTLRRPPVLNLYYGCTLLIVVSGHTDQKLVIHWHIEGKALSDPSVSPEDFPDLQFG
jgi:hypothetical protein